jgi:hypothetical protein
MKKKLCLLITVLILIAGVATAYCDCNLDAFPNTAQTGIALAPEVLQPNPADVQITIGAAPGIMITPTLQVVPEDVDTVRYLVMYLYLPVYGVGVTVPGKLVTLQSFQLLDLLPGMDLSPYAGLTFVVYYGYIKANGDIMYNAYTVKIADCGDK